MKLQTNAILYAVGGFVSKKNGKHYNTIGLILDGMPKLFFIKDDIFNSFLVMPVVKKFQGNKQPLMCKAMLDIRPTQNGFIANIEDLAE